MPKLTQHYCHHMFKSHKKKKTTWADKSKAQSRQKPEETWWCMPEHSLSYNDHVSLITWPAEALSKLGHLQQRRGKQTKIREKERKKSLSQLQPPVQRCQRRTEQDCERLRARCCFQPSALIVTISAYGRAMWTTGVATPEEEDWKTCLPAGIPRHCTVTPVTLTYQLKTTHSFCVWSLAA